MFALPDVPESASDDSRTLLTGDVLFRGASDAPTCGGDHSAMCVELIGLQFVQEADPATFVPADVQDDSASLIGDCGNGRVKLRPAVTALGTEHVAGQALGVDAHEHVCSPSPMSPRTRAMWSRPSSTVR